MNTLLLDSSNTLLAVGLVKDNVLVDEIQYECWQRQSENMIPEINNILIKNNLSPKEVDEIVVTIGPGSYTGVRIALTIAKVYAYALKIRCYAVSSLKALCPNNEKCVCVINARSSRSYVCVLDNGQIVLDDCIRTNEEVLKFLDENKEYKVFGNSKYLGIESFESNILENMLNLRDNETLVDDIFTLKAVYLKD